MSTESLGNDHILIKKIMRALNVTAGLWKAEQIVADIQAYTDHVSQHLAKNFGLFVMACKMLKAKAGQVEKELAETEVAKLSALGGHLAPYERLVESYDIGVRKQV